MDTHQKHPIQMYQIFIPPGILVITSIGTLTDKKIAWGYCAEVTRQAWKKAIFHQWNCLHQAYDVNF